MAALTNKNFLWGLALGYLVGSFFGVSVVFGGVAAGRNK